MENESKKQVAKAAGIVMSAILISRILGFVRERAVAEVFGRTSTTDVFFAAFALPDLMFQLLVGGALSSAFIPIFTEYLAKGEEKEAWYVASIFLNLIVAGLVVLLLVGVIFTPGLAPLVGFGFSGEQKELLVLLMRVTFPAVFFTALSGLSMGVLHSYQRFTKPALGPVIYNLGQILGAYLLGPVLGIMGMALGTIAGSIGSFSIQFPEVFRRAAPHYRFLIDLKHPGIRRMGKLMLPAVIGLSIAQINVIVGQNLASGLETGSIVALRLANRLINFPLGIFAMGISIAVFPTLARLAAKGNEREFKDTLFFGLRVIFFVTIPSAVGMAILRVPIVRLLFQSGEFTAADTMATASVLLFYAPGLCAQAAIQVLTRGYYSLQDTVTPVKIGFASVVLNFLLSLALLRWTSLAAGGLALAFSLSSLFNMLLALVVLGKKLGGLPGLALLSTVIKGGAASLVMGGSVYWAAGALGSRLSVEGKLGQLGQTLGAISLGIFVYFLLSLVFKMEETGFLFNLLRSPGGAKGRRDGEETP